MGGMMLVISMDGNVKKQELEKPDSDVFHAAVGGWLELVPYFTSIYWDGQIRRCIAFCDEDGKQKNKEPNIPATAMWKMAQARANLDIPDYLVGNVCVLYGDEDFMSNM